METSFCFRFSLNYLSLTIIGIPTVLTPFMLRSLTSHRHQSALCRISGHSVCDLAPHVPCISSSFGLLILVFRPIFSSHFSVSLIVTARIAPLSVNTSIALFSSPQVSSCALNVCQLRVLSVLLSLKKTRFRTLFPRGSFFASLKPMALPCGLTISPTASFPGYSHPRFLYFIII